MTGGTIIVRKGIRYVMTKVAHDGGDIHDHVGNLKLLHQSVRPSRSRTSA